MTDKTSKDEFDALVKQAGLTMTPEDADKVKTLFDNYSRLLESLRAADLDDEEVAGMFNPLSGNEGRPLPGSEGRP